MKFLDHKPFLSGGIGPTSFLMGRSVSPAVFIYHRFQTTNL